MTWKLVLFVVCTATVMHVNAIEYQQHEPEHYGPVAYEFHYSVHDPHTGDIKSQKEVRKDDKVEGTYELIDSDGHHRVVSYHADDHSGFEATVVRKPTDFKIPQPKLGGHAPLVHYSHGHDANQYDNHVAFSGPRSNYKY